MALSFSASRDVIWMSLGPRSARRTDRLLQFRMYSGIGRATAPRAVRGIFRTRSKYFLFPSSPCTSTWVKSLKKEAALSTVRWTLSCSSRCNTGVVPAVSASLEPER